MRVTAQAGHGTWGTAYSFVLPVLGLTVLFSVVPLVMVIQRSLYKGNIFGTDLTFAGLGNYADVFRTGGGHSLIVTVGLHRRVRRGDDAARPRHRAAARRRAAGRASRSRVLRHPAGRAAGGDRVHLVHVLPAGHRPVQPAADRGRAAAGHPVQPDRRDDRGDRVRRLAVLRRVRAALPGRAEGTAARRHRGRQRRRRRRLAAAALHPAGRCCATRPRCSSSSRPCTGCRPSPRSTS